MPFDPLVNALIILFITLAMACIGLAVSLSEVVASMRHRRLMGGALFANLVLVPLLAIAIVWTIPMPTPASQILLLVGFLPGGINAIQFSTKVPNYLACAAALLFVLSIAAVLLAPVVASFVLGQDSLTGVSYSTIAKRSAILVLLPMLLGMGLRHWRPELAAKLYKPAMIISTLAFIASVLLSMSQRQSGLDEVGTGGFVGFIAFILGAMGIGWWFGGPENENRQGMAVVTNIRNVGLVYTIVSTQSDDPVLSQMLLGFMAVMVPPNLVLTVVNAIWRKRKATATNPTTSSE